jgi:hypothetical protein
VEFDELSFSPLKEFYDLAGGAHAFNNGEV